MSSPPQGLSFEELLANLSLGDTPTTSQSTPTRSGLTTSWATAGVATQGVPGASVAAVQKGTPTPKNKGLKTAYVVFHGRDPGVYTVWPEVNATVNGFSNAIYRGYGSREEAEAAFAYALDHHWVCGAGAAATPIIFTPPTPLQFFLDADPINPLQGSERLDWQVGFRGIKPGVYSSVVEAMLNTSGVPNTLYKAYNTKQAAFAA
ncbi:hypothetical protein DFH08DRAFT_827841 [Mycena albidolilacea]|uniref:Ribonuclease H1 N-terminal domain-containing protein n=1 Tax=Mycena albidolilacea TaxID=1033008 RepID=A0AAD7E6M7_9AGAR|nr:hypothetical protein DFH08DRAFT_827841 [Mycena albidolilacea]